MACSVEYFHARVPAEIESWPADVVADYARIVELPMENDPHLGLPHSRALGDGLFELRPRVLLFSHRPPRHGASRIRQENAGKESNMADLKCQPVRHDHKAFLEKAAKRRGFTEAHEALEVEYALAREMLSARTRAGLTQEAVAASMGTTKSAVSRLDAAGRRVPSVALLKRYAQAVGCQLKTELVPLSA